MNVPKEDMDLSEFMEHVTAHESKAGEWKVKVPLSNGEVSTLTISDCYSEYDAKERSYLYLIERVYRRQK
jgi:hypothetical protein